MVFFDGRGLIRRMIPYKERSRGKPMETQGDCEWEREKCGPR